MTTPTPDPARLIAAHRAAQAFYRQQLLAADGPRRYLTNRGLGIFAVQLSAGGVDAPWHLGYAPPGWTTLIKHLTTAGFTPGELLAGGLARTSRGGLIDVFRDRIVFPVHNANGDPIAFIGRAAPTAPSHVPKYLNTTDTAIYRKRQHLYGLTEQADRAANQWAPVIVEGPPDVLAVWLAHPETADTGRLALAACGTALTRNHATTIVALPGARRRGITTAFDNDPAGQTATLKAWRLLLPTDIELFAAALPRGHDPADLIRIPDNVAELRAALGHFARPLAHAVIDIHIGQILERHPDAFEFVEGQVGVIRHLSELLTDLPPDQIVDLADYIADRTGNPLSLVAEIIIDRLEQHASDRQPSPTPPAQISSRQPVSDHTSKRLAPQSSQPLPAHGGGAPSQVAGDIQHTPNAVRHHGR